MHMHMHLRHLSRKSSVRLLAVRRRESTRLVGSSPALPQISEMWEHKAPFTQDAEHICFCVLCELGLIFGNLCELTDEGTN